MDEQERGPLVPRSHTDASRLERLGVGRSGSRRQSVTILLVVASCAVIAGGTGLSAILARTARPSVVHNPAASCVAPNDPPSAVASRHLGAWRFDLLEPGTFGSMATWASSLYALQACGTEETELRVVELGSGGRVLAVSAGFDRAALLTSSLLLADGSLYVGTAHLDLAGSTTGGPYDLVLHRLDPTSLRVLGSRPMGRGYGLSLTFTSSGSAEGTILASTGRALLAVRPDSLAVRVLASFGTSIAQHVTAGPSTAYVAVSLFAPGAAPADAGGRIELVEVGTGHVIATAHLGGGAIVESMALSGGGLFVGTGTGASSEVRRLDLPALGPPGSDPGQLTGVPAALETVDLDASGGAVWASELTTLACLDPATGAVLASTAPRASVSDVVTVGSATYALTSAGIGLLAAPGSCRPG